MITDAEMYVEVFEILSCMNKQEVMRIPEDILELIKNEKSKTYKSSIDKNDIFNPDNIDQRTINCLAGLMINYMANNDEREELIRYAKENEIKREELKRKNYPSEVFVKNELDENVLIENKEKEIHLVTEIKEKSVFLKIINFLKRIFKN